MSVLCLYRGGGECGGEVDPRGSRVRLGKGTGSTRNYLWVLKMVRRGMATEGYRWYSAWSYYKNSRGRRISCPSSVGRFCPTYSIMWRFDWSRDRRATLQGLPTLAVGGSRRKFTQFVQFFRYWRFSKNRWDSTLRTSWRHSLPLSHHSLPLSHRPLPIY